MSVGDWVITLLLLWIPVLNLILLFIWALSGTDKRGLRNFSRAVLILLAAMIVLWALFLGVWTSFGACSLMGC